MIVIDIHPIHGLGVILALMAQALANECHHLTIGQQNDGSKLVVNIAGAEPGEAVIGVWIIIAEECLQRHETPSMVLPGIGYESPSRAFRLCPKLSIGLEHGRIVHDAEGPAFVENARARRRRPADLGQMAEHIAPTVRLKRGFVDEVNNFSNRGVALHEVKPEIFYYRVFIQTESDALVNKQGKRFPIVLAWSPR